MRLLLALLLLMPFGAMAQEAAITRSDSLVRIDGESFIIHTVGPKQTLFALSKGYGITISRLVFANPGTLDGLKQGQHLRIPRAFIDELAQERKAEGLGAGDGFVQYTVPAKQTLYSIAREHGTTVSAIMEANPELKDGLKVGQTIRVPVPKLMAEGDAPKPMTGLPRKESAGEFIASKPTPALVDSAASPTPKPERLREEQARAEGVYTVSVLLPFFLSENDTLAARSPNPRRPEVSQRSEMALHFYEGLLMAVDSVRAIGLDVRLRVFDTENSESRVQRILSRGDLSGSDLIIGPFYTKAFQQVSAWAGQHGIPIVSPTIQGKHIIENSPHVFRIIPSDEQGMIAIGRLLGKARGGTNQVIHYGTPEEQVLLWRFRRGLDGASSAGAKPSFPAIDVSKGLRDSLFYRLSKTEPNRIVVLSAQEGKVASLAKSLGKWSKETDLSVYAPADWLGFTNVEVELYGQFKLHVPLAFHVDYDEERVQRFVRSFRHRFRAEPTTFSFRGYDIAMHFIPNLPAIRSEGPEAMLRVKDAGLQSDFDWRRDDGQGFENVRPRIVTHEGLRPRRVGD